MSIVEKIGRRSVGGVDLNEYQHHLQVPAAADEEANIEMTYNASTQRKIDALRKREESHGLNDAQRGILQDLLNSGSTVEYTHVAILKWTFTPLV